MLLDLPTRLLLEVLAWLTPDDIFCMSLACRELWRVCNGSALWSLLLDRHTSLATSCSPQLARKADAGMLSYRELFTQQWLMHEATAVWRQKPRTFEFEYDHSHATLKALRFVRARGDVRSAQRLLRRLYKLSRALTTHVEAAGCLLMMADAYDFSVRDQAERRATLVEQAVLHFGEARYWERAIAISTELRNQIKRFVLNAITSVDEERVWREKVARLQSIEESNALQIGVSGESRLFEQYFFVEFCGGGVFPTIFDGKRFVIKAKEAELLGSFVKMLARRFPDAQISHSHERGSGNDVAEKFVSVHPCKPVKLSTQFATKHGLPAATVPAEKPPRESQRYHDSVDTNVFLYSRPFIRSSNDPAEPVPNQFKDLFIEHQFLVTRNSFPALGRWSEVTKVVGVEKTPLENARDAVDQKNHDLLEAIRKAHAYHQRKSANAGRTPAEGDNSHALSMVISGVVDAAVSGGLKHYMAAFLTREYITAHPENTQNVAKLLRLIEAQKAILIDALELHKKIVSKKLLPFHENLQRCFTEWCDKLEVCSRDLTEALRGWASSAGGSAMAKLSPKPLPRNQARTQAALIAASMARTSARKSVDLTPHSGRNVLDIVSQVEDGDSVQQVIKNPRQDAATTDAQMATLFTPKLIAPGVMHKLPSSSLRRKLTSFLLRSRRGGSESPSKLALSSSSSTTTAPSPTAESHQWKRGVTPPTTPLATPLQRPQQQPPTLDLSEPMRPLTFDEEDFPSVSPATTLLADPLSALSPALLLPPPPPQSPAPTTALWQTPNALVSPVLAPTVIAPHPTMPTRKLSASVAPLTPLPMTVLETSDGHRLRRVSIPDEDDNTCLFFRSFYFADHPASSSSSSFERELKEIKLTSHSLAALSETFNGYQSM